MEDFFYSSSSGSSFFIFIMAWSGWVERNENAILYGVWLKMRLDKERVLCDDDGLVKLFTLTSKILLAFER